MPRGPKRRLGSPARWLRSGGYLPVRRGTARGQAPSAIPGGGRSRSLLMKRTLSLFGLAAVLALLLGVSGYAADVKDDTQTHEGTIVSVKGNAFTMTGADNKTHKH